MVVEYDNSLGMLLTALRFSHTVLPDVLKRWDFWFLFIIHLGLSVAFRTGWLTHYDSKFGETSDVSHISWHDIKVITAMTTFFEVFYTNQCYSRYLHLYGYTRSMIGHGYEILMQLRLFFGHGAPAYLRLSSRFVLASMVINFGELVDGRISEDEWVQLVDMKLLTLEEMEHLSMYQKQQHSQLLLFWAADVAKEGLAFVKAPPNTLKLVMAPMMWVRKDQQDLLDVMSLPIPFQYYHLLNVMVLVNLILWGYAMAICQSFFASAIFFMASLIFMGMMELANQLSDPFGDDEVDFPLAAWRDDILDCCEVLLHTTYPGCEKSWITACEMPVNDMFAPKREPSHRKESRAAFLESWSSPARDLAGPQGSYKPLWTHAAI